MKTAALTILLAAPLAAQTWEVGLNISQQSYKKIELAYEWSVPKVSTPVALRAGYAVLDLGPAQFQISAAYQPKVTSKLDGRINSISNIPYEHEYFGIGAMFNFKALVAVGAGFDYRFEKVSLGPIEDQWTTRFTRPWARVYVGYAFAMPVVKPFIGVEVAVPLTDYSYETPQSMAAANDGYNKAYAPKLQIGVYGGIRF